MSSGFSPTDARGLDGPDWLRTRRNNAAESFAAAAPPSSTAEQWRYSSIDDLDLEAFVPASPPTAQDSAQASEAVRSLLDIAGTPAAVVCCANGRVTQIELSAEAQKAGVSVGLAADHPDGNALLGSLSAASGDYFTLLNEAFAPQPLIVDVPLGTVLEAPVVVAHHSTGETTASFLRLFVRVGPGAAARVIDLAASDSSAVLTCPVVELDVEEAGSLSYLNVQLLGPNAIQIGSQLARAGRDARISAATAAFGGASSRSRADTRLVGSGAHGDLMGVYFADGEQTLDFRTYQDHVAPHTTSNLLYKGVVSERSRSIYTGLIRIRPEAAGVEAFQTNRNLKLSDEAWAKSVPNLEIENNDVRCSHASAVSGVDSDQRFYLESRGVPASDAERLVVAGFLSEVIDRLPLHDASQAIRRQAAAKLDAATGSADAAGPTSRRLEGATR